ncbi:MAG: hypothetical protein O9353_10915, partial [Bacteroidia bacterium]|nr:hypothetical protein [Bacteroidia bacterium]
MSAGLLYTEKILLTHFMICPKKPVLLALAALAAFSSCNTKQTDTVQQTVNNVIHIKGSDTEFQMVQSLAAAYMKLHPEIT